MTESFSPKAVYPDMSEIKVTRRMADLVLELYSTRRTSYDMRGETVYKCIYAGRPNVDGDLWRVPSRN